MQWCREFVFSNVVIVCLFSVFFVFALKRDVTITRKGAEARWMWSPACGRWHPITAREKKPKPKTQSDGEEVNTETTNECSLRPCLFFPKRNTQITPNKKQLIFILFYRYLIWCVCDMAKSEIRFPVDRLLCYGSQFFSFALDFFLL